MSVHHLKRLYAVVLVLLLGTTTQAQSPSAASLLPEHTSAYLSVPDVERLFEVWEATQLGHLFRDEQLQPFVEQLLDRVRSNGNGLQARFGVSLQDLRNVASGELAVAALEPAGRDTHATVIISHVGGREQQARALLAGIQSAMRARRATQQTQIVQGRQVTIYSVPGRQGQNGYHLCQLLNQDQLVLTDHFEAMRAVLVRSSDASLPNLLGQSGFAAVREQSALPGEVQPHLHWYVQPLSYARVLRSAIGERKRGTDMLQILEDQGFAGLQAVGGHVALRTPEHEVLHRTFVYSPQPRLLAARMLDFPNGQALEPADWVAANTGTYVSFRWRMMDAFEHSETLVNALAGENFFDDFLENLETDPNGPRVNLRRDLIAHLGERITFVSDSTEPITPKSDRFLVAVEITDTEAVARTVTQALQADPTARVHEIDGLTIWEIVNQLEDEDMDLTVEVEVEGAKFGFGSPRGEDEVEDEPAPSLPNSAIAVFDGKLLVSSHIESIVELVQRRQASTTDALAQSPDYARVAAALAALGATEESFRVFSRSDETYKASYELIRQGRVGESESLVARLINRLNGERGTAKHEQRLDGSKLPPFEYVSQYLGPAGAFVETRADGWMISGCLLTKEPLE